MNHLAKVALIFLGLVSSARLAEAQLVIHEILASNRLTEDDEDGDSSDWVEIYNPGPVTVDLDGWALSDDAGNARKWEFPALRLLPRSYLLVWCSGKDRKDISTDRIEETDSPFPIEPSLVGAESVSRVLTGAPETIGPPEGWASPEFPDDAWVSGKSPIGFGDDSVVTVLAAQGSSSFFVRTRFEFVDDLPNLVLEAQYDDGFVAFLNGTRVLTVNAAEESDPTFASVAARSHVFRLRERFDLSASRSLLRSGSNVLAVVVLNQRPTSTDLLWRGTLGHILPVLHTSFSLDATGGVVLLTGRSGEVVDLVAYPEQRTDHSFGLDPDGQGFVFYSKPSPRAENSGPFGIEPLVVADTKFSVNRGFYDAPFDLELSTLTPDATIRYTTNGSAPTLVSGEIYAGPIRIERTIAVRAIAYKEGHESTNVDTHTYVFVADVPLQDARKTEQVYGFPRSWGGTAADYGMDPDVVGANDRYGGKYAATIEDDLMSIPTISIVLKTEELFGPQGIYTNSDSRGVSWERAASAELMLPDGDEEGFQVDCGLRIQGGAFRSHGLTKKHSLRLLFKSRYESSTLRYPFFGDEADTTIDTITLRANSNDGYQWDAAGARPLYVRDTFGRITMLEMGGVASHSRFVHVYLNGVYWGLYDAVERPDAAFGASYFGGEKDDWDAMSNGTASHGDLQAWNQMLALARRNLTSNASYFAIQGLRPDGSDDPELTSYLDVGNLADYMIVNLWVGNTDWPHKNFWVGRDRDPLRSEGFKFYMWDSEWSMGIQSELNTNQTGVSAVVAEPYSHCRRNEEFQVLFGDRLQRHFFNGGALYVDPDNSAWDPARPDANQPARRFVELTDSIESAMVAESARWGDQHVARPYTRDEHWAVERDRLLRSYLPQRSKVVLDQFRAIGLYPRIEAPRYGQHGGIVRAGFELGVRAPRGDVWYTLDGTDPRLIGGAIDARARKLETPERLTLIGDGVEARMLVPKDGALGTDWTAADFDDNAWRRGATGIGFGSPDDYGALIRSDIGAELAATYTSVYVRIEFDIADPSALAFPVLRVKYDDGFLAYLNGELVASANANGETAAWDSRAQRANANSRAVVYEDFDISSVWSRARAGRNVLALHAMNTRATDLDMLLVPVVEANLAGQAGIRIDESAIVRSRALDGEEWSAIVDAMFVVDGELPLAVSEVMYHAAVDPASAEKSGDFDFIEILHRGNRSVDLSGVRLEGGIAFAFGEDSLEPGEHIVVVKDLVAFERRYGAGIRVAGEYDRDLGNSGDRVRLVGPIGQVLLEFRFDDAWYAETDGEGHSLVLADPAIGVDRLGEKESWKPSQDLGGSPGRADGPDVATSGWQLIGDADQDSRRTISDAVAILRHLFQPTGAPLPCEGDMTSAGNQSVLDVDADGGVLVTDAIRLLGFLFLGDSGPALGLECMRVDGCDDVCNP
jgi:hypothetical protein